MKLALVVTAWFLSAGPLVLQTLDASWRIAGARPLALAALPWIALAGLPRAETGPQAAVSALGVGAFALVPLAWGASLELVGGEVGQLTVRLTAFVGAVLSIAWFAERAARSRGPWRRHALVWFLCVPCLAAAWTAFAWLPDGGPESGAGSFDWGGLSPLVSGVRLVRGEQVDPARLLLPLALLGFAALAGPGERGPEPSAGRPGKEAP